jgi:hypothetical protein
MSCDCGDLITRPISKVKRATAPHDAAKSPGREGCRGLLTIHRLAGF